MSCCLLEHPQTCDWEQMNTKRTLDLLQEAGIFLQQQKRPNQNQCDNSFMIFLKRRNIPNFCNMIFRNIKIKRFSKLRKLGLIFKDFSDIFILKRSAYSWCLGIIIKEYSQFQEYSLTRNSTPPPNIKTASCVQCCSSSLEQCAPLVQNSALPSFRIVHSLHLEHSQSV